MPYTIEQIIVSVFIGLLFFAAAQDVNEFKISNRFPLLVLGVYPAYLWSIGFPADWWLSVLVACGVLVFGFILFSLGYLGGGDAKLMAAAALWAGPALVLDFLFVTTLVGGLMALILVVPGYRNRIAYIFHTFGQHDLIDNLQTRNLPYGVAIAIGGFVVAAQLLGGA